MVIKYSILMDKDDLLGSLIFDKYRIEKKIGEGSFGKIYLCKLSIIKGNTIGSDEWCALKIETNSDSHLLEFEASILCYLKGSMYKFISRRYTNC